MAADLHSLIYHLKQCPEEFLAGSINTPNGSLHTEALLLDVYRWVKGTFTVKNADLPSPDGLEILNEEQLHTVHIACWFFSNDFFVGQPSLLPGMHQFIFEALPGLSPYVKHSLWREDEERAEEFVRLALKYCQLLPDGETPGEAEDRLDSLDTIKRQMVLKESGEALERIKEIRKKMAEQKAREAANVYGRE